MAVADRKGGQKPVEGVPNHFEKILEGPCPNHAFPIKHLYKDCSLMKWFLSRCSNKHYYTNFTGGGHFWFTTAGKAVRRGLEATVNRGLTAAGGFARRG